MGTVAVLCVLLGQIFDKGLWPHRDKCLNDQSCVASHVYFVFY